MYSQNDSLGCFTHQADIGRVKHQGSVSYHSQTGNYVLTGSGNNIWFNSDAFNYLWKKIKGDFIVTANMQFKGPGTELHRKIGWMARSSEDTSSAHVSAVLHGDGLMSLQYRKSHGENMDEIRFEENAPAVIQLQRKGNTFIVSVARLGETFVSKKIDNAGLPDELLVGLFVCAHNADVTESAVFSNVRITIPANDGFIPYKDYIGSNLEVMDVVTGERKICFTSPYSLQAPNWTNDGNALIYNSNGLLYRFDLAGGIPTPINSGFAMNNNNDHVLSFNGKMIGISHHSSDDQNQSVVYTMPVDGGTPQRVTPNSPSYLHGWSPDGKYLIYTGGRANGFHIYKIPAEGGEEKQLTFGNALDDGSEYSPDGKYIYFNSARTGTMQIWRMKPDGSDLTQITDDGFNNWFPHISPDGRWIVFLTFLPDVKPDDHPFYRQVYLRLMPVEGGKPKVIAWLYGGQGSINVPSWSPDSRKIAFVSNSSVLCPE